MHECQGMFAELSTLDCIGAWLGKAERSHLGTDRRLTNHVNGKAARAEGMKARHWNAKLGSVISVTALISNDIKLTGGTNPPIYWFVAPDLGSICSRRDQCK